MVYLFAMAISLKHISDKFDKFFSFMVRIVDFGVFLISFLSLILLSYHRLRKLTTPFEESLNLNRFRIILIISIWNFGLTVAFSKHYSMFYLIRSHYHGQILSILLNCIGFYIPIVSILILNFLLIKHFKARFKNVKKNNFKNEKNAIFCTVCISFGLRASMGLWLIISPVTLYNFEFTFYLH